MTPTPMLIKAAKGELTSSEIQTALDELAKLNRGGNPTLTIYRGGWGEVGQAKVSFAHNDVVVADCAEDALCKAHAELLRLIAEEDE